MTTKEMPPRFWIAGDNFDAEGNPYQEYTHISPIGNIPLFPNGWHKMITEQEHQEILSTAVKEARESAMEEVRHEILERFKTDFSAKQWHKTIDDLYEWTRHDKEARAGKETNG